MRLLWIVMVVAGLINIQYDHQLWEATSVVRSCRFALRFAGFWLLSRANLQNCKGQL